MFLKQNEKTFFEDSLLIIKKDYLHKRRPVLLKLLSKGFQIQGNRRLLFSPENAAEFYRDDNENKHFMLLVIMLSAGPTEAFILAREKCVTELLNTMICYFGNSTEMEKNVHVSKSTDSARYEISYIFPNYIHEPLPLFYDVKFPNSPLVKDLMAEAHSIASGANGTPDKWKEKLAEWLTLSNSGLPRISQQCRPSKPTDDKAITASVTCTKTEPCATEPQSSSVRHMLSNSSAGSSAMITTSSCITCSCFDGEDTCYRPKKGDSLEVLVEKKKTRLDSSSSAVSSGHVCGEEVVEWREIVEEESLASSERFGLEEEAVPPPPISAAEDVPPFTEVPESGVTITKTVDADGTVTEIMTFVAQPPGTVTITEIVAEAQLGEPGYEQVQELIEEAEEMFESASTDPQYTLTREVGPDGAVNEVRELHFEGGDEGMQAQDLFAKAEELAEANLAEPPTITVTEVGGDGTVTETTTNVEAPPPAEE